MAAAERGAELTRRLLAFSRLPGRSIPRSSTSMTCCRGPAARCCSRTLGEHIVLEVVECDIRLPVVIDGPQLENALLNLCINARDAMPDGGTLWVEAAPLRHEAGLPGPPGMESGNYVTITVSDTGTGMNPEVAARAFEPFFTTKEVGKGSGLGLSMVFGFMKQSGGHVKIYSEPGHGTAVKMYIPRAGDALAPGARGIEGEVLRGGREKLLVVEDDPLVRDHVASQLRELGYQVTVAENGASALAVLDLGLSFDLLFTDVVMPGGVNGPALAAEAQRRRPGLRVLFTSGYTENGIVHQGRLDPGVMLLNKPYRRRDLAEKVREALDTPRLVSLG
jgi:CheY-like chemotaxis protein